MKTNVENALFSVTLKPIVKLAISCFDKECQKAKTKNEERRWND
jgi:hypothetical protein